jgi:putative acetyltransferase
MRGECQVISGAAYLQAIERPVYSPAMLGITIRAELPADVAAIEAVTVAAFANAPHAAHTEQLIVAALRRAGALSLSLVAEQGGEIVGHVALSPVVLSDGSPGWFGLGPISVLPEHQDRGIGSQLMHEALRRLRERDAAGCVLVGDPHFYTRFGFGAVPSLTYPAVPAEYFLALPFRAAVPQAVQMAVLRPK